MVSNTRLYAAAIALVSGVYSVWTASMATRMGLGGWIMLVVGVVVIVHGIALLTAFAETMGGWSGPLMIGYSIIMLVNQGFLGTGMMNSGGGMGMDGGMGGGGMMGGMAWDLGMVALAVLMLISGVIMIQTGEMASRM